MSTDAEFRSAVARNVERRSAFCVREYWGAPGVPLAGAMLWRPLHNEIGWLAVARAWRRRSIGRALIARAIELATAPEITVTTFSAEVPGGEPARAFYLAHGFEPLGLGSTPEPNRERFALQIMQH
jgi:GNAT superfamily N-acetyltransferase